jgi:hypothetical protein
MAKKKKPGTVLLTHEKWGEPREYSEEQAATIMEIQRTKKDAGIRYFKETITAKDADNTGDQKGDKGKESERTDPGNTARKES